MNQSKVLIADDNAGVRRMLTKCLDAADRKLFTAEDGTSALDMAREHLPDLIILDVRMPGRDGYEVCAALRADERTRKIPIMMLSGAAESNHALKGLEGGADDYLAKPFNLIDLHAKVESLLWRAA